MHAFATLANCTWTAAALARHRRFRRALSDPASVQRRRLRQTLAANADTAYGRRHGFAALRSIEAFRAQVPLTTWEDYVPYVDRIRAGESGVLTRDPVRRLMPTSGSTSARKLVPYTDALQRAFDRAIGPWIVDLFATRPALALGTAYWSISPVEDATPEPDTRIPIGFDSDTAYLGGVLGRLVDRALAVPAPVRLLQDIDAFRHVTLLLLLAARDLRLISVWHPTFMLLLIETLRRDFERLVRDLADGGLAADLPVSRVLRRTLAPILPRRRRRAAELERMGPEADLARAWPHLGLVSCWSDGHAAHACERLRREFPGVPMQSKGLIATEGFVSLPFRGRRPIAVCSHYFEFVADDGRVLGAEDLRPGEDYMVVITTDGGLYRYCLRDRVRVDGYCGRTPSLVFLGKADGVSDLCGEKLNDAFVAEVLATLFARHRLRPAFAMLAPRSSRGRWGYALYTDVAAAAPDTFCAELDADLGRNPQYRYCVRLGQLAPASLQTVRPDALHRYEASQRARGVRAGDLKAPALSRETGWDAVLA